MNPLFTNEGLSDDLLLGYVAWYTITKPAITHEELAQLVKDLGLSEKIIPKPPRAGDAFKRACRYSERAGLGLPNTENVANIMIRKVTQNAKEIERHMVLEIVDPQDRVLEHRDVARMRFEREGDDGTLHVKKLDLPNADQNAIVEETVKMFVRNMRDARKYIEAQVVRRMIREQLDRSAAIAMRRQGSVYFIPKRYKDTVEALETFCHRMGSGSEFFAVPLPDATKYREFITNAFEDEVHNEATQIIAKLKDIVSGSTQITSRAFAEYKTRLDTLTERAEEYGALVEAQQFKSDLEIKAMNAHLGTIMTKGLVKT